MDKGTLCGVRTAKTYCMGLQNRDAIWPSCNGTERTGTCRGGQSDLKCSSELVREKEVEGFLHHTGDTMNIPERDKNVFTRVLDIIDN